MILNLDSLEKQELIVELLEKSMATPLKKFLNQSEKTSFDEIIQDWYYSLDKWKLKENRLKTSYYIYKNIMSNDFTQLENRIRKYL